MLNQLIKLSIKLKLIKPIDLKTFPQTTLYSESILSIQQMISDDLEIALNKHLVSYQIKR